MVRTYQPGGLIRRNPGITFTLVALAVSFGLGVWMAYADWMPEIERTIVQCWAVVATWGITHYHVKWLNKWMVKYKPR